MTTTEKEQSRMDAPLSPRTPAPSSPAGRPLTNSLTAGKLPRNTPLFAPTFAGQGVVRLDDVRDDPRYGQLDPHRGMPRGHLPVTGETMEIVTDAFEARALQHELDHCQGLLFLDRVAGAHALHARKVYL